MDNDYKNNIENKEIDLKDENEEENNLVGIEKFEDNMNIEKNDFPEESGVEKISEDESKKNKNLSFHNDNKKFLNQNNNEKKKKKKNNEDNDFDEFNVNKKREFRENDDDEFKIDGYTNEGENEKIDDDDEFM